jgi:hypothetical protein
MLKIWDDSVIFSVGEELFIYLTSLALPRRLVNCTLVQHQLRAITPSTRRLTYFQSYTHDMFCRFLLDN